MTAPPRVVVEADGGSRGNPGPAGYGAVVLDAGTRAVLAERAEFIGTASNNVAEYRGLIAGLTAARDLGATDVVVRMDSQLVVEQMSGRWQVKHPAMKPLWREATELARGFASVSFGWIPRAENAHADRLANKAMDEGTGVAPRPVRTPKADAAAWTPASGERTRLILVRHGSTAHSKELRFSGRNDLPLDAAGEQQAAALAAALGKHPFGTVTAVVTSPLPRTRQTAAAIAAALGLDVDTHDDLVETDFGTWEGHAIDELPAAEVAAWRASVDAAPPGGESFAAVGRRVRRAREAIVTAHPGEVVVAVSHVTPIKSLVRFALDAPPVALFRMHLDTASVSVIDYFADGASSLRVFNDTSHLR